MAKQFNLNLTTDELKDVLSAHITQPYNKLIAETIVDALENSEMGLYHLVRALLGKRFVPKYKPLDKVLVKADQIATWRYNLDEMKSKDLIIKDYLEAQVVSVNVYKRAMYEIRYTCILTTSHEFAEDSYHVEEKYLMDIPFDMPDGNNNSNDDTLPF